jgi:hypothetical protein
VVNCKNILNTRRDGSVIMHQCRLVEENAQARGVYVHDVRCAQCSQKDDGRAYASQVIDACLAARVRRFDLAEAPTDCPGCNVFKASVRETLRRLAKRQPKKARDPLVEAVWRGMPLADAKRHAAEAGLDTDA